jgi:UDP-N-acetylmuramoyl-L-alanyl-D-glutamate--2,6-diaminopimelate ligase
MNGSSFNLHLGGEQERVRLQLPGLFSVENALCAASVCANLNLKIGTIVAGLENLDHVPGRLERIDSSKGFSVIIDYAHTPDSLEKLYSTLRPEVRGRMIAVLGSCGDRDKTKRPIMGALAARFCDLVYITDEEPYSEDPLQIIEEVSKGVPRGRALYKPSAAVAAKQEKNLFRKVSQDGEGEWWWKIPDRRQAIEKAIEQCKLDDLVLITGMGSQNFKIVNGKQEPWNDRLVVESILKEKNLMTKK